MGAGLLPVDGARWLRARAGHRRRTSGAGWPADDGRVPGSVARCRGHVDDSTRHGYEVQVRRHLKPTVGRRKLSKLAVAGMDAVWRAKLDRGVQRELGSHHAHGAAKGARAD